MLILSRKAGESLVIGDDVVVTVLDVRGGQIRIGIQAPEDIPVYREEIYKRIAAEKGTESPVPQIRIKPARRAAQYGKR